MEHIVYSKSSNAFYSVAYRQDYEAAGTWPADAVEVDEAEYVKFSGQPPEGKERVSGADGRPAWGDLPTPTAEQIQAQKVVIVQQHMDAAAQALNYDNIANAITYAEEPAVTKFQAEGRAFRTWRSLVWAKCYAVLNQVSAGEREIPTDDELIDELPQLIIAGV